MVDRWILVEPGTLVAGREILLDPVEARHISSVLRRGAGETVVLADGAGSVAGGRLLASGRSEVSVEVLEVERFKPPQGIGVTLALGVLHSQAMDWAVQKAVEVGVERFVPVLTARAQVGSRAAASRLDHWRRVARQAVKQCRRPWAMPVAEPVPLEELVRRAPGGCGLVADPEGGPLAGAPARDGQVLLVGPEGGLAPDERALLERAEWRPVGLGRFTLRAETAAVVGAALLELMGRRR